MIAGIELQRLSDTQGLGRAVVVSVAAACPHGDDVVTDFGVWDFAETVDAVPETVEEANQLLVQAAARGQRSGCVRCGGVGRAVEFEYLRLGRPSVSFRSA